VFAEHYGLARSAPFADLLAVLGFERMDRGWVWPNHPKKDLPPSCAARSKRAANDLVEIQEPLRPLLGVEVGRGEAVTKPNSDIAAALNGVLKLVLTEEPLGLVEGSLLPLCLCWSLRSARNWDENSAWAQAIVET
jgi:hypothetical protein